MKWTIFPKKSVIEKYPYFKFKNNNSDTEWYNWSQYMCRYALRFTSQTYQYFTETDFEVFQVEG